MHSRTLAALAVALLPHWALGASSDHEHSLGKVSFPTSCDPKVQADFDAGVAMLNSYWFARAASQFRSVLDKDPACAIAYWGIAIDLLGNTLAGAPSVQGANEAWSMLEKARAIGAKTARERDWIEAASAYFRDHEKTPVMRRLENYEIALEALVRKYPDDFEAKVFRALALQASASPSDVTYAKQIKSAEILERLYAQNPAHPGVTHFLIHAYDYPPLAHKGIEAAKRYAKLAPAAPHARHMPSHIYSMVGMWEESIASNLSALEVYPEYFHAYDFSVYAALQLGQDSRAKALLDKAAAIPGADRPLTFGIGNTMAIALMRARYVLERGDWAGAAALPFAAGPYRQPDSVTRFTRGIGMARTGDIAGAKREAAELETLRSALAQSDQAFWADRTGDQARAVSAWIVLAEGNRMQAESLMKSAADSEDASVKHVAMENRLYPLREMYAEVLLETGKPEAALREFETAVRDYPNRYRTLYGAARAAEASGNKEKASGYYAKLVALAAKADGTRPEVSRAKAYLAQN